MKLKVAVIGIGNMGKNHVRTYAELPKVDLVAIADLNKKAVKEMASQYGVKAYMTVTDLLKNEQIDAVSICVPTTYHYNIAKECIMSKVHVLIEKPITANIEEAKELLQLAKKRKVQLLVGHIERFNPAVKKVKEMIVKKELGDITAIIARRVGGLPPQITDVNIAIDLAIHDVDIINYLLEELPQEVYTHKKKNHIKNREDSIELFLKYKNTSAYIQTNWITPVKIRKLNITGTEGYLEMDYISQKIEFYRTNYNNFKEKSYEYSEYIQRFSEPTKIDIAVKKQQPLKEELVYFTNCITSNKKINSQFAIDALSIVMQT